MKAMKARIRRNPIFWILLTAPLALLLLCQLQPTFDDWTYYTVPQTTPLTIQSLPDSAMAPGRQTVPQPVCHFLLSVVRHAGDRPGHRFTEPGLFASMGTSCLIQLHQPFRIPETYTVAAVCAAFSLCQRVWLHLVCLPAVPCVERRKSQFQTRNKAGCLRLPAVCSLSCLPFPADRQFPS